ncbi:MAG TPA: hypothetical protein VI461_16715 [Chitinophagaceae bacterium]|nr:hypothetical protein [Chitinophagaceae bacterium]
MFTMMFIAGPENKAEGDRIFASHAKWMEKTHHKDGELAMFSYNVAKNDEYTNPMDPTSEPTGNTIFTVNEVYKSPAGMADHWKQAPDWADFGALMSWADKVKFTMMHGSPIEYSLW